MNLIASALRRDGSRHRRSPRQTDENSAYEVAASPLIRGEGAVHTTVHLATAKSLSTFPTKNENVNNFQIIQCHQGMEKVAMLGAIYLVVDLKSFFPIKFLKINVLCCSE